LPTSQNTQISVTQNQVTAFRLVRHHLLERAPRKDLISVVGDMTGAQAQLLSAAQISLWSRVRDLQIANIEDTLNQRTLVKAACMRRTLFLVPSKHLAVFVRGSALRAEKGIRWTRGKGVPDRVIDAAIDAALGVLDKPRTRPEIAERVSRALGVRKREINGGGWGSRSKVAAVPVGDITFPIVDLIHLVGARGVICYGPNHGNEPTFVRADAWIPKWKDLSQEEAEGKLLRRYLQAFGPATEADFALWCGISLTEAREIWKRERVNFVDVNVEGRGATILRKDLDALTQAEFESPHIRLLSYFDTFLIGHKDRQHLVDKKYQSKIFRPQGWIAPVVLMDGRAIAVWKHTREANRLHVQVEKFGSISRHTAVGIREEAQDLARFFGVSNVDVQIE
jgi:DNA glycosylase AlkZ-like